MRKVSTRPICSGKSPVIVPEEVLDAQKELTAKRKLNLILRSKSVQTPKIEVGDVVQVFIKNTGEKRGKWSSPKTVIDFNPKSGIVTLPGNGDRVLKVAAEDVRYALSSPFANDILRAKDDLDLLIDDALASEEDAEDHNLRDESHMPDDDSYADLNSHTRKISNTKTNVDQDDSPDWNHSNYEVDESEESGSDFHDISHSVDATEGNDSAEISDPCTAKEPEEDRIGPWNISYYLNLQNQANSGGPACDPIKPAQAVLESLSPGTALFSIAKETLQKYYDRFGGKEFSRRQAEGLPAWILDEAYEKERVAFSKYLSLFRWLSSTSKASQ